MQKRLGNKFPSVELFIDFYNNISNSKKDCRYRAKFQYVHFIKNFSFLEDAFQCDLSRYKNINNVIIFLYFTSDINVSIDIERLKITNPEAILKYFHIVDNKFWNAYEELKVTKTLTKLSQIIKTVIYLKKRKFDEITYEDLKSMYSNRCCYATRRSYSVPSLIESIMTKMNKKGMPNKISKYSYKEKDYGVVNNEIKIVLEEYLNKEYMNKGYEISSPNYSLKKFFEWLNSNGKEITSIKLITSTLWDSYKEYIKELDLKDRTKQVRIDLSAMFLEWLQENNIVQEKIIEFGDRYRNTVECKPRMLETREDYKKIARAIIDFEAKDEYELLVKNYLKVILATGFRLSEAKWIEPGAIRNIIDNIGEITLEIKDKTKIVNKTTSIMPWGIDAIRELENRLEKNSGVKLYNRKIRKYVYSLFQYEDRLISNDKIYRVFNKIINDIEFKDEYGNLIDYKNVKLHLFRHQKFNDIYEVSEGNIVAVKIDSNHTSTDMARKYTKQGEHKKKIEIIKAIEEGRIVGKSAKLLKDMMNVNVAQDKYIETVAKINNSSTLDIDKNKNINKFVGFGFCTGNCNKVKQFCEACDFFYTCKEFEEELKERYAKNFLLVRSRIAIRDSNIYIFKDDRDIIEGLKFQEKWLLELGVKKEEINLLKVKYIN